METSVNNKCKAFTSLEQSRKLAEILPLESADMRYGYTAPYDYSDRMYDGGYDEIPYPKDFLIKIPNYTADEYDAELPCWSLSALLGVLPIVDLCTPTLKMKLNHKYYMELYIDYANHKYISTNDYDNPLDACYELILKLNKLNLL